MGPPSRRAAALGIWGEGRPPPSRALRQTGRAGQLSNPHTSSCCFVPVERRHLFPSQSLLPMPRWGQVLGLFVCVSCLESGQESWEAQHANTGRARRVGSPVLAKHSSCSCGEGKPSPGLTSPDARGRLAGRLCAARPQPELRRVKNVTPVAVGFRHPWSFVTVKGDPAASVEDHAEYHGKKAGGSPRVSGAGAPPPRRAPTQRPPPAA